MAPHEQLERLSDDDGGGDDALSLCDLPTRNHDGRVGEEEGGCELSEALEDFEFRTAGCGLSLRASPGPDMCPADSIFHRGQLLPLRASLGSRTRDRSSSCSSSNCSSTCVSRSHSSSSHSSSYNKFYAHPSPSPQIRTSGSVPGRRSTGSAPPAGWGLFRLGVARAPEIELSNLRLRRLRSDDGKCGSGTVKKPVSKFRFGCKCAADVSEPVRMNPTRPLKDGQERKESISKRSRMSEWLEELSIV